MTHVALRLQKLAEYAEELDALSKKSASLVEHSQPRKHILDVWSSAYERGLWEAHVNGGQKFPSEKTRECLARTEQGFPKVVYQELAEYTAKYDAVKDRINHLKWLIDAERSILSALKLELEATNVYG